jgi:hypothetical protein
MSHNISTFNNNEPNRLSEIVASIPYILIGSGESNAYSNSAASTLAAGGNLFFYDSSPLNTINSATLTGANGWYYAVTLPIGNYIVESCFNCNFSASGILRHAVYTGINKTAFGSIGDTADLEDGGCIACAYLPLTTSATIEFKIVSSSNTDTIANQGNVVSEQSWILIRKVG